MNLKTVGKPCALFLSEKRPRLLWDLLCAGFRHSAGLHARVILDGATCRLKGLGDELDVLSVLVVW